MAEHFSLKDLSLEDRHNAFDKTSRTFKEPGVKLVLISKDNEDIALQFARENFITEEPIYKGLGMKWTDELEHFWKATFQQNLSLMILNETDGDPIALRTTRIARYDDKFDIANIKDQPFKELLRYAVFCDQRANFFGHFDTKEAFHFLGLAVAPNYQHRGYAKKIYKTAIDMIRNFGISPVYVKVEASSNFTKKIFEDAGMEILSEAFYDEWEVDGKKIIQNTGIHKSTKNYGMKLS